MKRVLFVFIIILVVAAEVSIIIKLRLLVGVTENLVKGHTDKNLGIHEWHGFKVTDLMII